MDLDECNDTNLVDLENQISSDWSDQDVKKALAKTNEYNSVISNGGVPQPKPFAQISHVLH